MFISTVLSKGVVRNCGTLLAMTCRVVDPGGFGSREHFLKSLLLLLNCHLFAIYIDVTRDLSGYALTLTVVKRSQMCVIKTYIVMVTFIITSNVYWCPGGHVN